MDKDNQFIMTCCENILMYTYSQSSANLIHTLVDTKLFMNQADKREKNADDNSVQSLKEQG